ncbi:hypothetical protein CSE45_0719 [Citreicella sp. SE45]|nr:hypothetical protein CSE45_0719 [Citreicella sp. SE45]
MSCDMRRVRAGLVRGRGDRLVLPGRSAWLVRANAGLRA